jgi:hypothetical protein
VRGSDHSPQARSAVRCPHGIQARSRARRRRVRLHSPHRGRLSTAQPVRSAGLGHARVLQSHFVRLVARRALFSKLPEVVPLRDLSLSSALGLRRGDSEPPVALSPHDAWLRSIGTSIDLGKAPQVQTSLSFSVPEVQWAAARHTVTAYKRRGQARNHLTSDGQVSGWE